ncbi:MAG: ATP-binding protein [Candidatus Omnitrophica bacterium]|nr:ATP-binding protein [Candidatus Omnitrophota bacterium]
MKNRPFWKNIIEELFKEKSIIWLTGVRRAGKTFLCKSFDDIDYFDCELPRVRRMMEDPESFLENLRGRRIVLDEVHRLRNPSEILKIAADHYPDIQIIATGSSTLSASAKFKDTLTDRKRELWLTPMTLLDAESFGNVDLKHRFLHGGLPPFFIRARYPERDFQDWIDAFWAKDIQELFRLERRYSFQKFFELIMTQSGGIFEANSFAAPCEASRTTIANYLKVLEATFTAHVIRPFSSKKQNEIISAPKVYGFDTGFVCYYRGWHELRNEDMGYLWEHFVLNEIFAHRQARDIGYWRDKQGHEIDFVINKRGHPLLAIECKWSDKDFDPANAKVFLRHYDKAQVYVVSHNVSQPYSHRYGDFTVRFVNLAGLKDSCTN